MYKTIALAPADGSNRVEIKSVDMKSADGKINIQWGGRERQKCYLVTQKGVYRMDISKSGEVYWARIGPWLVFYNGIELSWREAPPYQRGCAVQY